MTDARAAVEDIEEHFPGAMEAVRTWYKVYKVADGKAENSYAFGGKVLDKVRGPPPPQRRSSLFSCIDAGAST